MKTITLQLRPDDAEPLLAAAARDAAQFGAWCDYIDQRTVNAPGSGWQNLAADKKKWLAEFLRAKRIVEAFGVEYEPVSEAETLTVYIPMKNEKRKLIDVAGFKYTRCTGGEPDYKHPQPSYRRGIHGEACGHAAARVVARWRKLLSEAQAA
jgi:hypothetical protein